MKSLPPPSPAPPKNKFASKSLQVHRGGTIWSLRGKTMRLKGNYSKSGGGGGGGRAVPGIDKRLCFLLGSGEFPL